MHLFQLEFATVSNSNLPPRTTPAFKLSNKFTISLLSSHQDLSF